MRRRILLGSALVLSLAVVACAGHTPPVPAVAAPPRVDPDAVYVGAWAFDVSIADRLIHGTLTLAKDTAGWHGTVADEQGTAYTVRSTKVAGDSLTMVVEGPGGEPATVAATRQGDGTLAGKVIIDEGGEGTFAAKKK